MTDEIDKPKSKQQTSDLLSKTEFKMTPEPYPHRQQQRT